VLGGIVSLGSNVSTLRQTMDALTAGYPKLYNIEMDPHEDLIVAAMFGWVSGPALKTVDEYMATLKRYPNPPPPNITQFRSGG
jgi:hypothetical protein